MRTVKQLQNQLTLIEELVAERTPINKLKSKSRPGKNLAPLAATSSTSTEVICISIAPPLTPVTWLIGAPLDGVSVLVSIFRR